MEEDVPEQVITKMKNSHCTLGSDSCALCKQADIQGKVFTLLSLELHFGSSGDVLSQPLLHLKLNGKPTYTPYMIKRTFDNEEDAVEYSKKHKIKIVENLK